MTIEHYLIGRLAEVMYENGKKSPIADAVGCAIRNRVQSLGLTWYDAISQETAHLPENPFDPAFQNCLWLAENIFYGREHDSTAGSTRWTREPRSESVRIGTFYFYVGDSSDAPPIIKVPKPARTDNVWEVLKQQSLRS